MLICDTQQLHLCTHKATVCEGQTVKGTTRRTHIHTQLDSMKGGVALSLIPLTTGQSQTQILTRVKEYGKSHMSGLLSNAPSSGFLAGNVATTISIYHGIMKSITESSFTRSHE